MRKLISLSVALLASVPIAADAASWQPIKPIEFVVTSGAGGGTDNFARVVQAIILKYKFIDQAIIVTNKGGGSGAEGFVYAKMQAKDPYKLTFGTSNEYLLPYVARLGYKPADLTPVANMAADEFLLWVNSASSFKDAKAYIDAAKASPGTYKAGGSQSKDTDQILTGMIEAATGAKFIYVPFQGGNAAAVQLAGGHIDSNVNNPNENIGHWKSGAVRPLCVFSPTRLPGTAKVVGDMAWSDIPTCKEAGLPVDQFQMPRTVWLPLGVPAEAVDFYVDILKKVSETPEWKEWLDRNLQTPRFLAGKDFTDFIVADDLKSKKVIEAQGWIVK
ncbi:MAG: tripartite tricarboxylate transporter substrate binding protein [Rhodoplanes sp.]|uniref:Bug family tripartite tricarboxylate transporter substrate binding protein n=1 Tax=Rhodoplanes sp. TaxID=1968906 RepID=UPI0018522722|nr:tripartite tricarboxylate transporter substrate-binding protein [Rhodoplanes sp.]NVO16294.1 tripartite tricarboxylate transporter substrate binding protein [Rhodoplanes sp.]